MVRGRAGGLTRKPSVAAEVKDGRRVAKLLWTGEAGMVAEPEVGLPGLLPWAASEF